MTQKQFVKKERNFTIKLLSSLSDAEWQAKTLCEGWKVEDLAAHLVVRERSLIGDIGLIVPSLHKLHDKRIMKMVKKGHKHIIEKLNKYPIYMPYIVNTAEFWVHNEDFLRGELNRNRSKPNIEQEKILWESLKSFAKINKSALKDIGSVILKNSLNKEEINIKFRDSKHTKIVRGTPGELLLYFYGRRNSARIKIN